MSQDRIREVAGSAYELLGLEANALEEEIRRAHKQASARFAPDSLAIYGLYTREEALGLLELIDEAALLLLDPDRRRGYDQDLFPKGAPQNVTPTIPPSQRHSLRIRPLIPPEESATLAAGPLTGAALRALRESRGVSLREVHRQTRISIHTLAAIEGEQFAALPARVYLKGFLEQLALTLGLEQRRLLQDYLPRFEDWVSREQRARGGKRR